MVGNGCVVGFCSDLMWVVYVGCCLVFVRWFYNKEFGDMKFVMCCIVLSLLVGVVVFVIFVLGMLFVYVSKDKFEIGFCIDDLCVECWLCDCDYFVVVVMKFGVKVFV